MRHQCKIIYEKLGWYLVWRYYARVGKEIFSDAASEDDLKELVGNIKAACFDAVERNLQNQMCGKKLIHVYHSQNILFERQ